MTEGKKTTDARVALYNRLAIDIANAVCGALGNPDLDDDVLDLDIRELAKVLATAMHIIALDAGRVEKYVDKGFFVTFTISLFEECLNNLQTISDMPISSLELMYKCANEKKRKKQHD